MRHVYLITLFVCVLVVSVLGFRGTKFTSPPLDIFPEWAFPSMEHQPKLRPQSESRFFADGRSDRTPPPRTVARGMLRDDDHLHRGKDASGGFAPGMPAGLTLDAAFMERGRDRYQIYCAPCHGALGPLARTRWGCDECGGSSAARSRCSRTCRGTGASRDP